jgi:hypothetical protein
LKSTSPFSCSFSLAQCSSPLLLDLTSPSCLTQACRSTSTPPILLPKLIETSLTPPRAPPPLHARPLAAHHLLNRSAADPTAADHQPPLGKRDVAKNPSSQRHHRLHATSHEEEGSRAIQSESDGGVPLRCHQIRAGHRTGPAWLSPAVPARLLFFQFNLFCLFVKSLLV